LIRALMPCNYWRDHASFGLLGDPRPSSMAITSPVTHITTYDARQKIACFPAASRRRGPAIRGPNDSTNLIAYNILKNRHASRSAMVMRPCIYGHSRKRPVLPQQRLIDFVEHRRTRADRWISHRHPFGEVTISVDSRLPSQAKRSGAPGAQQVHYFIPDECARHARSQISRIHGDGPGAGGTAPSWPAQTRPPRRRP